MATVVGERRLNVSRFQDFEHRPMMLKDFLRDGYSNSNGFRVNPKSRALISSTKPSIVLLRSRSKRAAATTISAIQKVINVVKFFHFESVKGRTSTKVDGGDAVKVKVKDILRWRSFRDLDEEKKGCTPLDFPRSPDPTASTTCSFSKRSSSWCESDFSEEEEESVDDDHPWVDRNEGFLGKKSCLGLGQPANGEAWGNLKEEDWSIEESEQQSPVSVLYSPFRPIKISNVEITGEKCVPTRRLNQETTHQDQHCTSCRKNVAEENKARELLSHVLDDYNSNQHLDCDLLLDFFMEEIISRKGKAEDDGEILGAARSWMDGEYSETRYEWELEGNRQAYVEDMEKGVCWGSKFRQEQDDEVSRELEDGVMDELLDDLLPDFLAH